MRHEMKSLVHNGIYVPPYEYKGLSIRIRGQQIKLSSVTEQMVTAWVRKAQSQTAPPDKVFYRNFIQDFLNQLSTENPTLQLLESFRSEHVKTIDANDVPLLSSNRSVQADEIDFSEVVNYLAREQQKKLDMTKEEKKRLAQERKARREALKNQYGYASVDDKKIEIANWTAEPSCIFAGRGDHPKRGKWKQGPSHRDIILNLSPKASKPQGNWKAVVWEPDKMYLAKWEDKLSGKIKYVWFSDSAFLKQQKEKEKFDKAAKLGAHVQKIEEHIMTNMDSRDNERRKIATVCWLILEVNIRVGDEKDPEEADTVGAITLRPEHIRIEGDTLHFDFLGKDAVRWQKQARAPPTVIENIRNYMQTCKEYLFEGIDSKKVSRFLSEKMPGLTAKVFRTWKTTNAVKEYLEKSGVKKEHSEPLKQYHAKMANLEGAKIANHKRKIPPAFDERLAKRETKLKDLTAQLEEKSRLGKKTDSINKRIEKTKLDIKLTRETKEYNLGTSLKSYIDPRVYSEWAVKVDFSLDKLYSKALRKKFSWTISDSDCQQ